ncbi:MAG: DUF192 domain-containing protein [Candidatus Andersenbacteria bacterium]
MRLEVWIPVVFVVIGIGVVIGFIGTNQQVCRDFTQGQVLAGNVTLSVALAQTPQEQQTGLSGCRSIPPNSGMYFTYTNPTNPQFWMKGMLIPIDIIWISGSQVIGVETHVPAPTDHKTELLPTYKPPRPVTAVLEVAAGAAAQYGIREGTPVILK